MLYPISELYAWVIDDPSKQHGIVAFRLNTGDLAQAVTSEKRLADMMEGSAKAAAKITGLPVKLQRFVLKETVKTLT